MRFVDAKRICVPLVVRLLGLIALELELGAGRKRRSWDRLGWQVGASNWRRAKGEGAKGQMEVIEAGGGGDCACACSFYILTYLHIDIWHWKKEEGRRARKAVQEEKNQMSEKKSSAVERDEENSGGNV